MTITLIGKARSENLNQTSVQKFFKIMEEVETETCLGDVIGNEVAEEMTCEKLLKGIEQLGEKWNK